MTELEITAGAGPESEAFAACLRVMYAERAPADDEIGVQSLTFRLPDGRRCTVFARVGGDSWERHVRRYVIEPYRMTKNLVTGTESKVVDARLLTFSGTREP